MWIQRDFSKQSKATNRATRKWLVWLHAAGVLSVWKCKHKFPPALHQGAMELQCLSLCGLSIPQNLTGDSPLGSSCRKNDWFLVWDEHLIKSKHLIPVINFNIRCLAHDMLVLCHVTCRLSWLERICSRPPNHINDDASTGQVMARLITARPLITPWDLKMGDFESKETEALLYNKEKKTWSSIKL